jgi:hypothetical protein
MRSVFGRGAAVLLLVLALAPRAAAQDLEARVADLEAKVDALQRELRVARDTIEDLQDAACGGKRPDSCRRRVSRCEQPADPGPCKGSFPSFAFDAATGTCKRFTYGGCGGNDNRFATKAECGTVCGAVEVPPCEQPIDGGACDAAFGRWAWDADRGVCTGFTYGGCLGNENNFETQAACESACGVRPIPVCEQPLDPGPCDAALRRFRYDAGRDTCVSFTYGGCGGNDNNFATRGACERACRPQASPCTLAPDPGPCSAIISRWAFDAFQGTCSQFSYGGCGGNANNHESRAACERACGAPPADRPVCELPRDPGPCEAVIARWWFDADAGKCREFAYGGCGGNANNFGTVAACQTTCGVDP